MCLGLASGYHELEEKMTPEKALEWVEDFEKSIKEEQAIVDNGDEWHIEALKVFEVIKQALEKQIVKEKILRDVKKVYEYPIDIKIEKKNTTYRISYKFLFDDGKYYGDFVDIGESINVDVVTEAVGLLCAQAEGIVDGLRSDAE